MKNTKNIFLAVSLLVSAGMMHASEPEYSFTGQAAVKHLTATGECRDCDLRKQDLRAAITAIHSKNNSWDTYFFGGRKTIDLTHANLTSAYLQDANLSGAQLFGTNLTSANLTSANLTSANLYGANLYGANLLHANLINVINLDKATGYRPKK